MNMDIYSLAVISKLSLSKSQMQLLSSFVIDKIIFEIDGRVRVLMSLILPGPSSSSLSVSIIFLAFGNRLIVSGLSWSSPLGPYNIPNSRASFSSWACCLRSATWAAITLCRSAIRVHFAHTQSLHLQYRLCPFSADTTPWFLHRAHFGVRGYLSEARMKTELCESPFSSSELIVQKLFLFLLVFLCFIPSRNGTFLWRCRSF